MTEALMPGIAPITEPIQEQRMTSHQWVKQSTLPCHRPRQLLLRDLVLVGEHRRAADQQVAEFGQREDAERQRHERQAFPEIKAVHASSAACRSADRSRSSPA